jgi:replicative DNA helicase
VIAPAFAAPTMEAPYSEDAERALLGSVLINPDAFEDAAVLVKAGDFFIVRHDIIWSALARLRERGDAIDYIALAAELKAAGKLADVGGEAYLTGLMTDVPNTTYVDVYAQMVVRTALRRRMLGFADKLRGLALNEKRSIDDVLADAERDFADIRDNTLSAPTPELVDLVGARLDHAMARIDGPDAPDGVPTGWAEVDALTHGLQRKDLIVLAGRPGMGKSAVLVNMALAAAKDGHTVGMVSLEMGAESLVDRMIAVETGVPLEHVAHPEMLTQDEYKLYTASAGRLAKLPILIEAGGRITPDRVRLLARRWKRQRGLALLIVDYLQLMTGDDATRRRSRYEEVSDLSIAMKALAMEVDVPVVLAAQLSRAVEQRQDKRPLMSDLRDSGQIEQDADLIAMLYRPHVYDESASPHELEFILCKHRNGPTATVPLYWEGVTTRVLQGVKNSIDLSALTGKG